MIDTHMTASQWIVSPDPPQGIEPVCIDRVRNRTGVVYAIRQSGACMDAEGNWEYEPIPSSRTDDWLDRFRFGTWEEAAKAIHKHVKTPCGRFSRQIP
jgi:hypothetical protein